MIMRNAVAGVWLALLVAADVLAGAQVMPEFKDVRAQSPEALPHVELKAIIAEFLDPLDTGLGKSLGYLIWRETLTAISDQAGAGVIIAEAPPGERLVDMLKNNYHLAAERIARHQRARMALWGVVEPEGDRVVLETYVSIRDEDGDSQLRLGLSGKVVAGPPGWGGSGDVSPISALVTRNRFRFAPVNMNRRELFERPLITAAPVPVYRRPDQGSEKIARVGAGKVMQALDMQGAWFKIALENGESGYVDAGGFGNLKVPPRMVVAALNSVNLRAGPGTDHRKVATRPLRGEFLVRDMRYRSGKGLWYRIDTGERETWVAGWLVKPRFSVPVVHFLAGLMRYYGERPQDGVDLFEQFLQMTSSGEDNVTLAATNQLLGTCRLLGGGDVEMGYRDFSTAINYTPYDPDAYLLRSVAALGSGRAESAIADLDRALQLDPKYLPARRLTAAVAAISNETNVSALGILTGLHGHARDAGELLKRYAIAPDSPPR